MRSGAFNENIDVLVPKLTINEFGEKILNYEFLFSTRANIPVYSGSRYVTNDEVYNDYTRVFVVRIYHLISEKMLIKYDEKLWRITSIIKDKTSQEQIIHTELYNE